MNLNRLKSNLVNREWSSKSTKTNISYIKGKLNQFGLNIPKYLQQGVLSDKQIQSNVKRIVRVIDIELDKRRKEANIPTMDKAMKKLEKAVDKHNQLVYKKLNYLVKKHNLTENQLNFFIGRDVSIDGYKMDNKIVIRRQNTQFGIIDLENFYADSVESVNSRIRQINKLNNRLTNQKIDSEVANDLNSMNAIDNLLSGYVSDGHVESHVKSQIMEQLKTMNGMQQKAFYNILMSTTPKVQYKTPDEEVPELMLNIYNKWTILLNQARRF